MNNQERFEKYKQEHCSKCKKNIDCKIIIKDNKIYCVEED